MKPNLVKTEDCTENIVVGPSLVLTPARPKPVHFLDFRLEFLGKDQALFRPWLEFWRRVFKIGAFISVKISGPSILGLKLFVKL